MSEANKPNRARMVLVALILLSGAYWAGARYSARQPLKVEAVPAPTPSGSPDQLPISAVPVSTAAQRDAALTDMARRHEFSRIGDERVFSRIRDNCSRFAFRHLTVLVTE